MKSVTLTLTFLCLLCAPSVFSQTDTSKTEKPYRPIENRKNEIKLGAVKLIAGPILDLEYERVLTMYSSLGGNVVVNLNDEGSSYNFSVCPFYRIYFTQNREYGTKGFFAQGFMGYYNGDGGDFIYDNNTYQFVEENWNSFDAGLSIGWKLINKQGFVFQILGGLGRKVAGDDTADMFVYQADLYVGYRF